MISSVSIDVLMRDMSRAADNRYCVDCGRRGIQQCVDLTHYTFLCTQCAAIHRTMHHNIKTINMSNFTLEQVNQLKSIGGNTRHRQRYLALYTDPQYPPSAILNDNNEQVLKQWIHRIYIDKQWYKDTTNSHATPTSKAHTVNNSNNSANRQPPTITQSVPRQQRRSSNNNILAQNQFSISYAPSATPISDEVAYTSSSTQHVRKQNVNTSAAPVHSGHADVATHIYDVLCQVGQQYRIDTDQLASATNSALRMIQSTRTEPLSSIAHDDNHEYNPFDSDSEAVEEHAFSVTALQSDQVQASKANGFPNNTFDLL